jgi:hypothetical protein
MKSFTAVLLLATVAAVSDGCGSSNDGLCSNFTAGALPACLDCVTSNCSDQISTLESACSSVYSCVCACNTGDTNCVGACESVTPSPSCASALEGVQSCEDASCKSQCTVTVG